MPLQLPDIDKLFVIAPLTTLIMLIAGVGFYVGWRSRGETIRTLREWLDSVRKK